jgi:hypothetical protein
MSQVNVRGRSFLIGAMVVVAGVGVSVLALRERRTYRVKTRSATFLHLEKSGLDQVRDEIERVMQRGNDNHKMKIREKAVLCVDPLPDVSHHGSVPVPDTFGSISVNGSSNETSPLSRLPRHDNCCCRVRQAMRSAPSDAPCSACETKASVDMVKATTRVTDDLARPAQSVAVNTTNVVSSKNKEIANSSTAESSNAKVGEAASSTHEAAVSTIEKYTRIATTEKCTCIATTEKCTCISTTEKYTCTGDTKREGPSHSHDDHAVTVERYVTRLERPYAKDVRANWWRRWLVWRREARLEKSVELHLHYGVFGLAAQFALHELEFLQQYRMSDIDLSNKRTHVMECMLYHLIKWYPEHPDAPVGTNAITIVRKFMKSIETAAETPDLRQRLQHFANWYTRLLQSPIGVDGCYDCAGLFYKALLTFRKQCVYTTTTYARVVHVTDTDLALLNAAVQNDHLAKKTLYRHASVLSSNQLWVVAVVRQRRVHKTPCRTKMGHVGVVGARGEPELRGESGVDVVNTAKPGETRETKMLPSVFLPTPRATDPDTIRVSDPDTIRVWRAFGDERDPKNWRFECTKYDSTDARKNSELRPRPITCYCIRYPWLQLPEPVFELMKRLTSAAHDIPRTHFEDKVNPASSSSTASSSFPSSV